MFWRVSSNLHKRSLVESIYPSQLTVTDIGAELIARENAFPERKNEAICITHCCQAKDMHDRASVESRLWKKSCSKASSMWYKVKSIRYPTVTFARKLQIQVLHSAQWIISGFLSQNPRYSPENNSAYNLEIGVRLSRDSGFGEVNPGISWDPWINYFTLLN